MLVLSRQRDETIIIGEGDSRIEICVVDIRGDKVRLGVNAPKDVPVHRLEVYNAIKRESRAAAQVKMTDVPTAANGPQSGGLIPKGASSCTYKGRRMHVWKQGEDFIGTVEGGSHRVFSATYQEACNALVTWIDGNPESKATSPEPRA